MGNGKEFISLPYHKFIEPVVAELSGSHFNGDFIFCSIFFSLETYGVQFDSMLMAPLGYHLSVGIALFSAEVEVHVGYGNVEVKLAVYKSICHAH